MALSQNLHYGFRADNVPPDCHKYNDPSRRTSKVPPNRSILLPLSLPRPKTSPLLTDSSDTFSAALLNSARSRRLVYPPGKGNNSIQSSMDPKRRRVRWPSASSSQ